METVQSFQMHDYVMKAQNLLEETRATFARLKVPAENLPTSMTLEDDATKLVFVGQYSAGKSSLIKMLTGIDTGIGAAIVTDTARSFDWNGIEIIDTPGIQTGLRPDHDEKTKKEISKAALLVFVITNEGFDRTMGNHFRKLAFEEKRGGNMVLVVNKMDRAVSGNSKEQQEVMLPDIREVTTPLDPEALYLSFTSTEMYEEALEEKDEEIKNELMEESGFQSLVSNLNAFVRDRGLNARIARPLYTLAEVIRKALSVPAVVQAVDGAEEITRRKLRILESAERNARQEIQDIAMTCQLDINAIGRNIRSKVQVGTAEDDFKQALETAQKEVESSAMKASDEMKNVITQMLKQVQAEVEAEIKSPFGQEIRMALETIETDEMNIAGEPQEVSEGITSDQIIGGVQKAGNAIQKAAIGEKAEALLANKAGNPMLWNIANLQMKGFSGTFVHEGVKTIGHFFGVKFKPWEALKITKGIGIFGAALSLIGVAYSIYSALTGADKEREAQEKLKEARDNTTAKFEEAAQDIYGQLTKGGFALISDLVKPERERLEQALNEFSAHKEHVENTGTELGSLLERTEKLLELVNKN